MDYCRNFSNPMAARLFGWKHKSKLPEDRQLDSHPARYCRHPNRSEPVGDHLDPRFVKNSRGGQMTASACEIQERRFPMIYTIVVILIVLFLIGYLR